jgi:ABC-type tungstate transport system permease subunit
LFTTIGQVPWALTYSEWYHQYPQFPLQALKGASVLDEYTLTDRGTWLSSPSQVTDALNIYKRGDENDPQHLLLNPAHCLQGTRAPQKDLASSFMNWVISDNGGQEVVATFKKNGQVLYTPVPANERND